MLYSKTICSIFEAPGYVYTLQLFESSHKADTKLITLDGCKLVQQMVNSPQSFTLLAIMDTTTNKNVKLLHFLD